MKKLLMFIRKIFYEKSSRSVIIEKFGKILCHLIFILIYFQNLKAQAPDWNWTISAGGTNYDNGNCVATDSNGNVFVTGYFQSPTLTFGTSPLTNAGNGYPDIFIVKYDENGNVLWAKSAGGIYSDIASSVATDANGNVLVTGYFGSPTITFGTTTLTNTDSLGGYGDIFIVKYDGNGNVLWAKSAGGTGLDNTNSIANDANGNVVVTGYFESPTITFGTTTLTNAGSDDIFIVKYDGSGNVLWAKGAGGIGEDWGSSVVIDGNENVLVTGWFSSSTLAFGTTTLTKAGDSDFFIVKYDGSGNIIWAISSGGIGDEFARSVATDANGNILITGDFYSSTITFGTTTLTNAGFSNIFIVKYDESGNVLWAKSAGGPNYDDGSSVAIDINGNVLLSGYFTSPTITFGTTTLANAGLVDIFIVKYDGNGNVLWAKSAGGIGEDWSRSVVTNATGYVLVIGSFESPWLTFGTITLTNAGGSDMFLVKLTDYGVSGFVFNDLNSNCLQDSGEVSGLGGFTIAIEPGNIVTQTNTDGVWYVDSLPAGNYSVTVQPTATWLPTCPLTQSFSVTAPDNFTIAPAFGFISTQQCPEPTVSVNAPFLRRCFSNQNVYVNACNKVTATGALNNAYIILKLDSLLIPQSSSLPYTDLGNGNLRFDIGNLNPGICTQFSVVCSVSCNTVMEQTLCMKANLYPADSCVFDTITVFPSGVSPCILPWDKSSLMVEGSCVSDTIGFDKVTRFVVYNTGEFGNGDMDCYSPVRIYTDGVMIKLDSIKLNGGDSAVFTFPGDGRTWRLEADQHPKHPGSSHPNATVEACGETVNWTPGLVNALPMDDNDPVVDIFCGVVSGSYDPNDKNANPTGAGQNNNIMPNQKIDYTIRFQNTGNDTAFTVVIRDTLDNDLDIASVNTGASSHNYIFRMYGPRVLEWTFNNILLPDSNINEPASHGFVAYTVNQIKNLPNETAIKNTADIYFDFNAPVRTNTVVYQVQDNIQSIITSSKSKVINQSSRIQIFPNPASGKFILTLHSDINNTVTFSVFNVLGKKIIHWKDNTTTHYSREISLQDYPAGVYFLKVMTPGWVEVRKIVLE